MDKIDIYDFGVILLEIVSGRPIESTSEVDIMKDEVRNMIISIVVVTYPMKNQNGRTKKRWLSFGTFKIGTFSLLQLQESILADEAARRSIVDPVISRQCCDDALKIVMEICLGCLREEPTQRPSAEDVLWNLQFAAQVQESLRGESQSCEESSLSPSWPPRSPITL